MYQIVDAIGEVLPGRAGGQRRPAESSETTPETSS